MFSLVLTRSTFPINVGHPPFWASTRHCTDRHSVYYLALCGWRTWREFFARIHTFILNTCQAARTVHINSAFWFFRRWRSTFTVCHWVSYRQMFRTSAACCMVLGIANSIGCTRRICNTGTWIYATTLQTSPICRAICVHSAFNPLTAIKWIASIARRTSTSCTVGITITFCVGSTRHSQDAWIKALTIIAHFVIAALTV